MDARSFQQHAARVAELTDTLLAQRTANKAAAALGVKPDSPGHHPASETAAALSGSATPGTASPNGTAGTTPDRSNAAVPAVSPQMLFTPEKAGTGGSGEAPSATREGHHSCPAAVSAASMTPASAGGRGATSPLNSEALLQARVVPGPYYCTVCNVSATSAVHLQTHYMGSKHQRRLAQSDDSREHSPHYCSVCGISATSAVHLQLHLNGRAHQRKAKLAAQAEAGAREHAPAALADHPKTGDALYCLLQQRQNHPTLAVASASRSGRECCTACTCHGRQAVGNQLPLKRVFSV